MGFGALKHPQDFSLSLSAFLYLSGFCPPCTMDAPDLNVVGQLPQGSQTLVKMSEADYLAWSPKCGCCERGDGDSPVHY